MSVFAITRCVYDEDIKEELLEIKKLSVRILEKQKGFISVKQYICEEMNEMVSIIEWETKEDHEKSMESPDWDTVNPTWIALTKGAKITFEVNLFEPH
ncbi:MAG: antibiotic biosynthesis monooxygenase [Thermodesulfobacteriales bacterium]